jgi:hypothetical protein
MEGVIIELVRFDLSLLCLPFYQLYETSFLIKGYGILISHARRVFCLILTHNFILIRFNSEVIPDNIFCSFIQILYN